MSDFTGAARDYLRIQSAQVLALKNGEGLRFSLQAEQARRRKEAAKQAILDHQEVHGCS